MKTQKEFKSQKKGGNMVWNADFKVWGYGYCILELMSAVINFTGTPQDWACQYTTMGGREAHGAPHLPENLQRENSLWGRRDVFFSGAGTWSYKQASTHAPIKYPNKIHWTTRRKKRCANRRGTSWGRGRRLIGVRRGQKRGVGVNTIEICYVPL